MTNPFYVASGTPATSSFGASQPMRSEFQAIQGGFEKFPDFTGSAPGTFLINNFTATGITTAPGMLIDPAGNIGIGIAADPLYLLNIAKNQNGATILLARNSNAGTAASIRLTLTNDTSPNGGVLTLLQLGANYTLDRFYRPSGAIVYASGAGGLTLDVGVPAPIYFNTNDTERMRIDQNGNVGLGRPDPNYRLDVLENKNAGSGIYVTNSDPGSAAYTQFRLTNGSQLGIMYLTGTGYSPVGNDVANMLMLYATGDGGIGLQTSASAPIKFITTNVERMRIDAGGIVTIPGQLLINGPFTVGAVGVPGSVFFKRDSDGAIQTRISENSSNTGLYFETTSGGAFSFFTSGAGFGSNLERMRISSNGTVTLYGGVLELSNTTPQPVGRIGPNWISNSYGGLSFYYLTNGSFVEGMRINEAGNVGIGMTAPSSILDITRNQNAPSVIRLTNYDTGSASRALLQLTNTVGVSNFQMNGQNYSSGIALDVPGALTIVNAGNGMSLYNTGGYPILFGTGNVERMRIDATGLNPIVTVQNPNDVANAIVVAGSVNGIRMGTAGGNASIEGVDRTGGGNFSPLTVAGSNVVFKTGVVGSISERMRISADGYLKVSDNGTYIYPTNPLHEIETSANNSEAMTFIQTSAAPLGVMTRFYYADPNNSSSSFYRAYSTNGDKFNVYSHGGIGNFAANNVNYSDVRGKYDITRYSDVELDALEDAFINVDWGKFKLNGQVHDDWNHGPTAQGIEAAFSNSAPELIEELPFGPKDPDTPKEATISLPRKMVYETDLNHISHALLARLLRRYKAEAKV